MELLMEGWLKSFQPSIRSITLIFDQCFSGGMNDIAADGRVIVAACKEDQSSYDINPDWNDWGHKNTLFGYYFIDEGMLQDKAEGTTANDGIVTVEEAFCYTSIAAADWISWYNANYGKTEGYITQDPQMFDWYPTETDNTEELFL